MDRDALYHLVVKVLKELNEEWEIETLASPDEETRLFGSKSGLDSISLVTLISEVEDRVRDEYDRDIVLASDIAMSMKHSPFRRVGTLVDYLQKLLDE